MQLQQLLQGVRKRQAQHQAQGEETEQQRSARVKNAEGGEGVGALPQGQFEEVQLVSRAASAWHDLLEMVCRQT